ncbi:EF hand [compost metagenome]
MTRERKGSFLSRLFRKAVPQPPVQEDVGPQDFGINNEDEKERTCDSTPEKKREMYEVFQMFDVHYTGSIGLQEVKNITEKLGIASALSDHEVRSLLATVDDDNDGKITFDEFYLLFNEC